MIELRSEHGDLMDEIVGKGCYVHLERMDEHWFCLIVDDGERTVMVNIGSPQKYRRKVNARVYSNEDSDLCMDCLRSTSGCKCTAEGKSDGTT